MHVPPSISHPGAGYRTSVITDDVSVQVQAIVGQESYWELFDDNLPEIGIAVAWISIYNGRRDEIRVEPKRWCLSVGSGRSSLLSSKEVLRRYYKGRKIRMYSVHADHETRQRLARIALGRRIVPPAGTAEGYVFMRIESPARAGWNQDARLVVRGAFGPGGKRKEIEIPLHADR